MNNMPYNHNQISSGDNARGASQSLILFIFGFILICIPITVVSLWPDPRADSVPADDSKYPSYYSPRTERISSWDDVRLKRQPDEETYAFITRVLYVVHNATFHCAANNYKQSWFTWLSWKLGIYSLIPRNTYGVLDVKTFRCGFCHQRAFILAKALRDNGVNSAEVLGLNGHVVTVVNYKDDLYALDPDIGVGPVKITGLDQNNQGDAVDNPATIDLRLKQELMDVYNPVANVWSRDYVNRIIDMYLTKNNKYYNFDRLERLSVYQGILFSFEKIIEYSFIIIGSFLVCLSGLMRLKNIQSIKQFIFQRKQFKTI